MQSQQIQADRFECRDRVFEPLLDEITLGGEIGDDPVVPRRDRRIGAHALVGVRQRLLQLLEPRPHFLRILLESMDHIRQIAELVARLFGQRLVQLLGGHAERELRGPMGERRR